MILSACRRDSEEFMDDVDVTGLSLLLCQQSGEVLMNDPCLKKLFQGIN